MNEVIENILTRRSVRSFSEKQILKNDIELLIKTGLYAPSGKNQQSWKFTAILNKEIIKELEKVIGKLLDRDGYNFFNASALIIPSNNKESRWGKEDNACALQNIFLAAHSLNIGSVWINQLNGICDNEEVRDILNKVGIPADHVVYGMAALGYYDEAPKGMVEKHGEYAIVE